MNSKKLIKNGIILGLLGMNAAQVFAGDWAYRDIGGRDEKLCQILRKRLNQYDRIESPQRRCAKNAMLTYPGLTNPPWEELAPEEHQDLLFKLLKYDREGPQGYFNTTTGLTKYPDGTYKNELEYIMKRGIRLQVWRTRITEFYDYKPAPPGEQTIVQILRYASKAGMKKQCPGMPVKEWFGHAYIVTPDLKGPDPAVDTGTAGSMQASHLVLYEGQTLGITGDEVIKDSSTAGFNGGYCSFAFVQGKK